MPRYTDRRHAAPQPDDHQPAEHSEVRTAVVKFLLMGVLAPIFVALPVTFWIHAAAEKHSLHEAIIATQRLADHTAGLSSPLDFWPVTPPRFRTWT